MAFGFSSGGGGRASVGGSYKAAPKSVQDIINRASTMSGFNTPVTSAPAMYQTPGASMSPVSQTPTISGAPLTGAGFAAMGTGGGGANGALSASGGGGGGSSVTPLANDGLGGGDGTNAFSGWMARFAPAAFRHAIWNDPQIILNQMYQDAGLPTTGPNYSTLRNLNGADPMSLMMLQNPGMRAGDLGSPEHYGNFLHNLYSNQMAAGGSNISFNQAIAGMNGLGNQSQMSPDQQSALYQTLTRGGAPEQFRSYYALASDAAKMGLSPSIASAYLDALARQGDTYITNQAHGGAGTPFFQTAGNLMR